MVVDPGSADERRLHTAHVQQGAMTTQHTQLQRVHVGRQLHLECLSSSNKLPQRIYAQDNVFQWKMSDYHVVIVVKLSSLIVNHNVPQKTHQS